MGRRRTSIEGGYFYSLALDHQGHAWAWGPNDFGQIGDGTSGTNRLVPTAVHLP